MTGDLVCIIPAKGYSSRLPRKNLMDLCGKPLLAYTIEAAINSKIFKRIIVSSEDNEVLKIAESYGAEGYLRSAELSSDNATVIDVCFDVLSWLDRVQYVYDSIAVLLATAPLRDAGDIRNAYNKFSMENVCFLMGVTNYSISPFWALREKNNYLKFFFNKKYIVRSQLLPKVFADNGSIYMAKTNSFKKERTFYGKKLVGYFMPPEKSIDIDEKSDFIIAESLMLRKIKGEI